MFFNLKGSMKKISLGIGEVGLTKEVGETLEIIGLGSCIGLSIFSIDLKVVGMAHIALPDSKIQGSSVKIDRGPGYFADLAVVYLLEKMNRSGYGLKDIFVKIAGGASVMDPNGVFSIGKRNYAAVKTKLSSLNIKISQEDCGGNFGRTMRITPGNSMAQIISLGKGRWEI